MSDTKALLQTTAVQWSWRSDTKWEKYDPKVNIQIEIEFRKGSKKISVDDQRFVDLNFKTKEEIRKNFAKLDCDDEVLLGVQRRFDDEMRRRAVRRDAPPIFNGLTVVILTCDAGLYDILNLHLNTHAAFVRKNITARTKYAILNPLEAEDFKPEIEKAQSLTIPIITPTWVLDSLKQGKTDGLDISKYSIPAPSSKKRKKEDDIDDASTDDESALQPKSKKQKIQNQTEEDLIAAKSKSKKLSIDPPKTNQTITNKTIIADKEIKNSPASQKANNNASQKTNNNASITASQKANNNASNLNNKPNTNNSPKTSVVNKITNANVVPVDEEKTSVLSTGLWMGVCVYESGKHLETYPFMFELVEASNEKLQGTIEWPTLNMAKTKFKGKIIGDKITFVEYEAIVGEDEVELPIQYKGIVKDEVITGKVDDEEREATFKLEPIKKPLVTNQPIKIDKTYTGTCILQNEFNFSVTSRKQNEISGQIAWGKEVAQFLGTIEGSTVNFEIVKGCKEFGHKFTGKLNSEESEISGTFKVSENLSGNFTIQLNQ